jgi:hypothetical protein
MSKYISNHNSLYKILVGISVVIVITLMPLVILSFVKARGAQAGWWQSQSGGTTWAHRQQLTLTNNSGEDLAANTTVAVTVNTKSLVSSGKLQSDCDDLRIVYQANSTTTTELSRYISYPSGGTCATAEAAKVYFPLQATFTNNTSTGLYYMYYANGSASSPSNSDNAFDIGAKDATLVCPFDGSTTCAAGEVPNTATGAIRYSGSKSAISFDGINDDVTAAASSSLANQMDNGGTVEFWMNPNAVTDSNSHTVLQKSSKWNIKIDQSGGNYRIDFTYDRATVAGEWTIGYVIVPNQWTHFALTYNPTSTANDPVIYINGVSQTVSESQTPQGARSSDTNDDFIIGSGGYYYPGQIDEVRYSDVVRYATTFTPSTSPFIRDEHTKLLFHFDESGYDPRQTSKAVDDSGNGNHGTITGVKYVAGLVGTDASTTDTGKTAGGNTYAGHEGIFIEEDTTNKITNPSFEHSAYNTVWDAVGANLTASKNTTAPYVKFGINSLKLVANATAISGTSNSDTIGIDPNSTATHILSFYAYDGTSGNIGGTITNSIVRPVWQGTAQSTGTYTDMGGGWWRVSYSAATTDATNEYGVQAQVSKTVYIDGVQLEDNDHTTSYADGSLTSEVGGADTYFWDDDCDGTKDAGEDETADQNAQCSSRTKGQLSYANSNISNNSGTLSFWYKRGYAGTSAEQRKLFYYTKSDLTDQVQVNFNGADELQIEVVVDSSTKSCGNNVSSIDYNEWHLLTLTYTFNSGGSDTCQIYSDGAASGTGNSGQTWAWTPDSVLGIGYDTNNTSYQADSSISDFRLYNTKLTSAEITDLYKSGLVSHSNTYEVDAFSENKGQNPVGIYHFDPSASSGLAHDSSAYGNHLTVTSASYQKSSAISVSQLTNSLKFDGTDDMASRSAGLARDFNFGTGNFSITGWFRHSTTLSGTDTIIAKYNTAGYKVYINSTGQLCFGIDDDSTWGPDDPACYQLPQGSFAHAKWHHFEAVRDTTAIYLYVDGQLATSDNSLQVSTSLSSNANFSVGVDSDKSNFFDGYIDEITVYPYARTADQVKTDYGGPQTGQVFGTQTVDPLTNGLVGHWKMDESAGNTCPTASADSCDSSGNVKDGTWNGNAANSSGKYGNGVVFDGTGDYVEVGDIDL